MIINKLLYLILLITSGFFYILYSKPLSLYILVFVVALPLFLGICILSSKFLVSAELKTKSDTALQNDKINFILKIKNKTIFPFPNCIVTIYYTNSLTNIFEEMTVSVPLHSMCNSEIGFSFISEHCGIISANIKSIQIFDFIRLFSIKIKPKEECFVTVFPEVSAVSDITMLNTVSADDSDVFSKQKSGDDPSEIFALKDYVSGDKLNRIHWKLSIKYDNLIVRHYSLPVDSSILIVLDFWGVPDITQIKTFDAAVSAVFSAAYLLTENKIPFSFSYYSMNDESAKTTVISDFVSLSMTFEEIFSQGPCEKTCFADEIRKNENRYSKIIFVTTSSDNVNNIINVNCQDKISVHFVKSINDSGKIFEFEKDNINNVHVIYAQKPETGISEILI